MNDKMHINIDAPINDGNKKATTGEKNRQPTEDGLI